jgi:steroid delta-isomerase-like uncharacterized protein
MTITAQDQDLSVNIAIITRFEHAFRAADQTTIDELADPDLVDHNAPDKDPTLAAFKQKVAGFKAIFPDLVEDLQDIVAGGDTVATRWVLTGSQQQEFMGIPAAGQPIRVEGMNFYRLRGGRVTDMWTQFDGVALMQQLSAIPAHPREETIMDSSPASQDFQTTLDLSAPADTVFEALTTTSGVSHWWAPATGSAASGGDLVFTFGEHPVRFRVTDADRPARVRWLTVDCDVMPDWVGTAITFDLSPTRDGGTTLQFRHTGLVPQLACYEHCSRDWGHFLHSSLASYLETGTGHPVGS